MATFNKFNSFVEAVAEGVHDLGANTLMVALTNSAPSVANTQLSNITQISYANLSARTLSRISSSQTGGQYALKCNALTLTASGSVPTFQYIVIYNDSASNKELIGWYNYGSGVTLADGDTFTITFDDDTVLTLE